MEMWFYIAGGLKIKGQNRFSCYTQGGPIKYRVVKQLDRGPSL